MGSELLNFLRADVLNTVSEKCQKKFQIEQVDVYQLHLTINMLETSKFKIRKTLGLKFTFDYIKCT